MLPQSAEEVAPLAGGGHGVDPLPGLLREQRAPLVPCLGNAPEHARYRQERDWLSALPGVTETAACLLAAHATGCIMAMRPQAFGSGLPLRDFFARLSLICPDRDALEEAVAALGAPPADRRALSTKDAATIDALWPLTAPTEFLLASGGDERLALDPHTGLNRYGCAPWPRPELISFGSCTASSLSEAAFAAAEQARRDLVAAALATSPATALAEKSEAISTALLKHFNVEDLAEAVLAASGTDAALVVTSLLAAEHPGEAMTSILVSPAETGSGVPYAVQGRHFASCAPSGSLVGKGEPIDGMAAAHALVTVALRDARGFPRQAEDINADIDAAIRAGITGGRAVLHAMDGSKTGLTAPDRAGCRAMLGKFGDRLDIVVDACQARIEPDLVRWYLRQGFPVLITGSKFFAAPGFCGAVLFPRARLNRISRAGRLPAGLAAYARLQGGFGSRRCPGLVLRWTAALYEMARFAALPAPAVRARLRTIGEVIRAQLAEHPPFRLVAAPRPQGCGWSDERSVFTFTVRGPRGWLTQAELRPFYQALDAAEDGPACQTGQPVEVGTGGMGGARLAVSAAQVVAGVDCADQVAIALAKLRRLLEQGIVST